MPLLWDVTHTPSRTAVAAQCGIIINPEKAKVLCSFYVDFTSWNSGCKTGGLLGIFGPQDWARDTPYPADQLKDMMEASEGIQSKRTYPQNRSELRKFANGQPGTGWYNEVLIDSPKYEAGLPASVAAIFYVEGGDPSGPDCLEATRAAMIKR